MSRPRFLGDNDLNDVIVRMALRQEPAMEFLPVRDAGLTAASDAEVLEYSARNGFIVVSHDVGTMPAAAEARLAAGEPMPGLLVVRQRQPIPPVVESLVTIWAASEAEEWESVVTYLPLS